MASDFGGFIGTSPTMLALYEQIQSAARSMAWPASQRTVAPTSVTGSGPQPASSVLMLGTCRSWMPCRNQRPNMRPSNAVAGWNRTRERQAGWLVVPATVASSSF